MSRRMFSTQLVLPDEPAWEPLEAVARLARATTELPSFHEGEFMYMAAVYNVRKKLMIHLYKHIDTRRYLNLDDAGHAYEYCGVSDDHADGRSGGRYRLHRGLADAIRHVELYLFDADPALYRSFPPERWPNATWFGSHGSSHVPTEHVVSEFG